MLTFIKKYFYHLILNSFPEACQIRTSSNRILTENSKGKELFGNTENPFLFLKNSHSLSNLQQLAVAFEKRIRFETKIKTNTEDYLITLHPLKNDLLLKAKNITGENLLYHTLKEKNNFYISLLNNYPHPVYILNSKNNLYYSNESFSNLNIQIKNGFFNSIFIENCPEFGYFWQGISLLNTNTPSLVHIVQFPFEYKNEKFSFGIIQPISEQLNSQADNNYIFDNLPFSCLKINSLTKKIELYNQFFISQFKKKLPQDLGEFFSKDSYSELNDQISKMLHNTNSLSLELSTASFYGSKNYQSTLFWGNKEKASVILILFDTSEKKQLEQQVNHAQKMQALGQLTGGIAHDFNNILTAIIGFSDLLLNKNISQEASIDVLQIKGNAQKASGLVSQLLTFSRKQPIQLQTISIYDALTDLTSLLKRTLSPFITLKTEYHKKIGYIKMDLNQLTQIFLNLAINSKDAMPSGGIFSIKASIEHNKKSKYIGNDLMPSGEYIKITVSDNGSGIEQKNLPHIFEPFFSTKTDSTSSGTGLGLSTVYGIIRTANAFISVDSEKDIGTTFTLYFPKIDKEKIEEIEYQRTYTISETFHTQKSILLVDDEDAVRLVSARALRNKGYIVSEASHAEQAKEILKNSSFDLLLTDMVMPGISGEELSQEITQLYPHMKIMLMSGYSQNIERHRTEDKIIFLQKPFDLQELIKKVSESLES